MSGISSTSLFLSLRLEAVVVMLKSDSGLVRLNLIQLFFEFSFAPLKAAARREAQDRGSKEDLNKTILWSEIQKRLLRTELYTAFG